MNPVRKSIILIQKDKEIKVLKDLIWSIRRWVNFLAG